MAQKWDVRFRKKLTPDEIKKGKRPPQWFVTTHESKELAEKYANRLFRDHWKGHDLIWECEVKPVG